MQVAAGNYAGPPSIVANQSGFGIMGLHDHSLEDLGVWSESVSGWTEETIVHDGHDGWNSSLVLDSGGILHTSSLDQSGASFSAIEFARRESSGWVVEQSVQTLIRTGTPTTLAFDPSGDRVFRQYGSGPESDLQIFWSLDD